MQIVFVERSSSASFHLFKVIFTADVAHENQTFNRFDVCAGGDHIHRNGNAGIEIVSECAQNSGGIAGSTGDFLTKLVAFAEFLPDNLNDIVSVAVRFGEDERFWGFPAVGKQDGEIFSERSDNGANLAGVDHVPIHGGGVIGKVVVHLFPAFGASEPVSILDLLFQNERAVFCNVGFNEKNVFSNVDAVQNRLFSRVFADNVLIEKRKRAFVRRGGQTDNKGVEIL